MNAVRDGPVEYTWGDDIDAPPIKVYGYGEKSIENRFGTAEVPDAFEDFDADLYFTHFDTWMNGPRENIPELGIPYASYCIVDHWPVPKAVVNQVANAEEIVAMSEWAKKGFRRRGLESRVITHGAATDTFKPSEWKDKLNVKVEEDGELKENVDLEDKFIFGIVAANFVDRKNIPEMMQAFSYFLNHVDEDARLFIHMELNPDKGFNIRQVVEELEIPQDKIIPTSEKDYNKVGDSYLNNWYNAMDVLLNCTMAESWGLTITEAMAAGTPAIVTNFSSMPEQIGVDTFDERAEDYSIEDDYGIRGGFTVGENGIAVSPSVKVWRRKVSAMQTMPHPRDIFRAMKYYYENRDVLEEHSERAREKAVNQYDWDDCIVPKFKEMFDELEEKLV